MQSFAVVDVAYAWSRFCKGYTSMAVNHSYEITWLSTMAIGLIVLLAKVLEKQ